MKCSLLHVHVPRRFFGVRNYVVARLEGSVGCTTKCGLVVPIYRYGATTGDFSSLLMLGSGTAE